MGPGHENAGRGEYFRELAGRPATITAIVLGASLALVLGAYLGGGLVALAAPVAVVALVLGIAFWLADSRAEQRFWIHVERSLGFAPLWDPAALEPTTPLLHAGDCRAWEHAMAGPLGGSGLEGRFALYRYDVRKENAKGEESWDSHRFTVCLVELEPSMRLFPGIYLRERRGLLSLGRHDWLRGGRLEEAELESAEFNDAYELRIAREQDEARLRELFDPKTIVWLQDHPLRPHIELRAGFLVVYVREHLDDLGRIVWLLDATERLAVRVQDEVGESRTAIAGG